MEGDCGFACLFCTWKSPRFKSPEWQTQKALKWKTTIALQEDSPRFKTLASSAKKLLDGRWFEKWELQPGRVLGTDLGLIRYKENFMWKVTKKVAKVKPREKQQKASPFKEGQVQGAHVRTHMHMHTHTGTCHPGKGILFHQVLGNTAGKKIQQSL